MCGQTQTTVILGSRAPAFAGRAAIQKLAMGAMSKNSVEENVSANKDVLNIVPKTALEPLLKIEEVAHILGRTHWTLRQDIKAGRIKCVRVGKRLMIEPSEVRRVIEQGRDQPPGSGLTSA